MSDGEEISNKKGLVSSLLLPFFSGFFCWICKITRSSENPSCHSPSYLCLYQRCWEPISVSTTGSYGRGFRCTSGANNEDVSVDTVIGSVISKLESIFLLEEELRMTLEAFIVGKDVFVLLLAGFGSESLSDWLKWANVRRDRWFIHSLAKCCLKVPALFQTVSLDSFPDGSVL